MCNAKFGDKTPEAPLDSLQKKWLLGTNALWQIKIIVPIYDILGQMLAFVTNS